MNIPLGFEVGTGDLVELPLHHAVITGLTRLSGKTTTCKALMGRLPDGYSALAFRTKRGELGFEGAHPVQPYFVEQTNWEYVESLLEAAMKERLKFERSWIIKAAKGAQNLRQVYRNIVSARDSGKVRGLDESVYTNLAAYFEKVLPQLEKFPFARSLPLLEGPNVMDLGHLSEEVQALVISSCLRLILRERVKTFVVIPEAWKFLPQGRGNPVKWEALHVIREGGALGVYLWLDSQDVTGVEKSLLKSCDIWLLGRQREVNEVRRVLGQLPGKKPKPEEVMGLGVGQFFASFEDQVRLVYVWPAWMDEEEARAVALGKMPPRALQVPLERPQGAERVLRPVVDGYASVLSGTDALSEEASRQIERVEEEDLMWKEKAEALQKELEEERTVGQRLQERLERMEKARRDLENLARLGESAKGLRDALVGFLNLQDRADPARQVVLAPPEVLRERFQVEAVQKLSRIIEGLSPEQKAVLRLLLVTGKMTRAQIARQVGTSEKQFTGQGVSRWHQLHLTPLSTLGLIRYEGANTDVHYTMEQAVRREIGVFKPSDEDILAVVQRLENLLAESALETSIGDRGKAAD